MDTQIVKLLEVLDQEATCYREMKRVLDEEKRSLSLSEKARIGRIEREKEALVEKIKGYETLRKSLVDRLAEIYPVDAPVVTVSKLARCLPAPADKQLLASAEQLRSLITAVRKENQRNQQLIHQYLDLIKGTLKLLTHLIDDHPVYCKPGTTGPGFGYRSNGGRLFHGSI